MGHDPEGGDFGRQCDLKLWFGRTLLPVCLIGMLLYGLLGY